MAELIAWEKPVGDAIAKKLLRVDGIESAVALGSDNLAKLPGALVLVPELEIKERFGNFETWSAKYPIVIVQQVLRRVDQTLASMVTIVGNIRIAWWDGIKLDLPYVVESYASGFTPELFSLAGKEYPSYRGEIHVTIKETRATPRTA